MSVSQEHKDLIQMTALRTANEIMSKRPIRRYVSSKEAIALLGRGKDFLKKLADSNEIKTKYEGAAMRYSVQSINEHNEREENKKAPLRGAFHRN